MASAENELSSITQRLQAIEREKAELLVRQQELLSSQATAEEPLLSNIEVLSPQQKVELFSSLFRGRDDIYALRWENKQGRSGYSVACSNEWKPGLCNKPKIKCGECNNRSFSPLDSKALYDHLLGKITVGLYPLLSNDECWLLAVDFDKSDWKEAVSAFRFACKSRNITCAVERSRSGNGAHAWIFFEDTIAAKDARRLGFALLDKAMENHAGLSFDSYDRLFPNQDVLPTGGFGNLIALPLQHGPRKMGSSEFIDENFQSYHNQWSYLSSLKKVNKSNVYDFLKKIDVSEKDSRVDLKPWEKNLPAPRETISGCPETVTLILANRIYLSIEDIPQALLARLKRVASFSNPVFFKTQALRFSTHGIPRFICLAHIEEGYLSLPRGCIDDVLFIFEEQSVTVEVDDKRKTGKQL